MADYLDELTGLAREYLTADEQVLGALSVTYAGKVNLSQTPTGLAALGQGDDQVAAGEQLARRIGSEPVAVFPQARQMALVLSPRRLLVWSRGGLKGRPKAFLGEVPLAAIEQVGFEDARTGATRISVRTNSGWEVNLESSRHESGVPFAQALAEQVERARPDPGAGPEPEHGSGPTGIAREARPGELE